MRLQKFDETIKKICLTLNKIEKDTEKSRTKTSRNKDLKRLEISNQWPKQAN